MRSFVEIIDSTAEPNSDLILLEDLKSELGIIGTAEDAALALRITRVSKAIAALCDRDFAMRDVVETFRSSWPWVEWIDYRSVLFLSYYPVIDVMSVTVNDVETSDYEFDAKSGRLWPLTGVWFGKIEVTYTGGYDLPEDAPPLLSSIVIEAIRQRRSFSSRDPSIRQVTHGEASVGYFSEPQDSFGGFSSSIVNSLQPFRRLSA